MECSRQVVLVTDHSKFTRTAIARLGNVKEVNYLFTDQDLPLELQTHLFLNRTLSSKFVMNNETLFLKCKNGLLTPS